MAPLVVHVTGARPNFPKAAPVLAALGEQPVEQLLVHTGQHYDDKMSDVFFRQLGIPKPDVNLGVGSGSHGRQTAKVMEALEELFEDRRPDMVIVYGDVNSTVAAALVASKMGIAIAHVEAGLRSFDMTMPEEINRLVTDRLSDLLLTTSVDAVAHLGNEGVAPEKIHFVGNPMIDTLLKNKERFDPAAVRSEVGIEGDYHWAAVTGRSDVINVGPPSVLDTYYTELRSFGDIKGRLGYADGATLWFVSGGAAVGDILHRYNAGLAPPSASRSTWCSRSVRGSLSPHASAARCGSMPRPPA